MALDTPAHIAVIGGGPVGLEAALYGRYLGYEVTLYECSEVAQVVRDLGASPLPVPFRDARSTLGLAALAAQDDSFIRPDDTAVLSHQEWYERYLWPLAQSDLLAENIQSPSTVIAARLHEAPKAEGDVNLDSAAIELVVQRSDGDTGLVRTGAVLNTVGQAFPIRIVTEGVLLDELDESIEPPADLTLEGTRSHPNYHYFWLEEQSGSGQEAWHYTARLNEIRSCFAFLADRADLDVYRSVAYLVNE